MIPGTRSTVRALSESPEAIEASGMWAVAVVRSFFYKVTTARDLTDIRVAAGSALQDLDELQGVAQYDEFLEEEG